MDARERAELSREVAVVVAEVMANSNERVFGRMVELQEAQQRSLDRLVALEERQEKLLEHVVSVQERMGERQDKMLEALGLILEKLRRS